MTTTLLQQALDALEGTDLGLHHRTCFAICAHLAAQPAPVPLTDDRLHTFLNAAAGEGLVLDGVDAADLYIATFPERYAAVVASIEGHGIAASPEQPK